MKKIFVLNSSLPEAISRRQSLDWMGPFDGGFRGRNIGNGYITYAFLRAIGYDESMYDHASSCWSNFDPVVLAQRLNSEYSQVVFVMQDFLRLEFGVLNFGRLCKFLEQIRIPVVPVSLGANSLRGFEKDLF